MPGQLRYTLTMPKPALKALIFMLLPCLLLAACGNKGPLVRPPGDPAPEQVPADAGNGH